MRSDGWKELTHLCCTAPYNFQRLGLEFEKETRE